MLNKTAIKRKNKVEIVRIKPFFIKVFTADKNAARNIAKSTLYDDKTHTKQDEIDKMKTTAQEYYNITVDDFSNRKAV